jgi:hypothetical protein
MTIAEIISIVLAGARLFKKPAEEIVSAAGKDAYQKVKEYLGRKLASSPDAKSAFEQAEQKPDSEGRKAVLLEEVEPLRLEEDEELVPLIKQLRKALGSSTSLTQQNVNVTQSGKHNSLLIAGRDIVQPQHHTIKNEVMPDDRHVTSEQKKVIKELVDELALRLAGRDGRANYKAAWGRLYDEFNITSYHLLPVAEYDMAVRFLREQKAIARSRLRRRNPQAYRNDFYATIHASAKSLGWTDQQIYEFAEEKLEKKPIRSLRKLGPIQLKKLAGCISRMANRDPGVKEDSSQLSAEQSRSAVA